MAKTATCTLTDEHWFDGKSVELNPGLIAIIGNKGSGKSALADILALAGNSHCADLEFLTEERFRGTGNKAAQFKATLVWADETPVTVNLNDDFDPNKPERLRYLPQHFIEKLCNEITKGDNTNFNRELRKVIFNHVKEEDRLGHGSLDELLDYLVQSRKEAIAQEQQALHTLNDAILRNEHEMSAESIDAYEKALALKRLELDALDKNPLTEVKQPTEDPNDVETKALVQQIDDKKKEQQDLLTQIQRSQEKRQVLVAEQATLKRLSGHVDNFDSYHQQFVADHTTEFENAGFDINQIVAVTITRKPIEDRLTEVTTKLAETTLLLDGKQATENKPEVNGLIAKAKASRVNQRFGTDMASLVIAGRCRHVRVLRENPADANSLNRVPWPIAA